jgi:hypothetical protein
MSNQFPRTTVGGVSLSRLIIGTNWILGYSHTGAPADALIKSTHSTPEATAAVFETFLAHGVDTVMGPFTNNQHLIKAVKLAEDCTGKKLIVVDTPAVNVNDSAEARREAEATFKASKDSGATFCLIHHYSAEQLVNKNKSTMDRLPDYLKMIRDNGLIPGLSCHMPELVLYSDANGYDVETYIQIYNSQGFLMQVEAEYINKVIWNAKKPVMTIKPMASGRVTPFVGFNFVWNTIRPCDMVTVGCMTPQEADEDVEISFAALERRMPVIEGRSSPARSKILGGTK